LDIYGKMLDMAYLFSNYVAPIGYGGWRNLRALANGVAAKLIVGVRRQRCAICVVISIGPQGGESWYASMDAAGG
jgi:hypothetical protein